MTRMLQSRTAMTDYPNPYSAEHLKQLDEVIREASNASKLCQDCAEIGLPFPEEAEQAEKAKQVAIAIKRKWFPNNP